MKYLGEAIGGCLILAAVLFWAEPEKFGDRAGRFMAAFSAAQER